jgi:sialic acid synthase SpsE
MTRHFIDITLQNNTNVQLYMTVVESNNIVGLHCINSYPANVENMVSS